MSSPYEEKERNGNIPVSIHELPEKDLQRINNLFCGKQPYIVIKGKRKAAYLLSRSCDVKISLKRTESRQ